MTTLRYTLRVFRAGCHHSTPLATCHVDSLGELTRIRSLYLGRDDVYLSAIDNKTGKNV